MSYSIIRGGGVCFVHASFHWKSALLKHQHAQWLVAKQPFGPQSWTECLQDVSLWCPSPFGSVLGVTMSIMHACGHSQELCNDISVG